MCICSPLTISCDFGTLRYQSAEESKATRHQNSPQGVLCSANDMVEVGTPTITSGFLPLARSDSVPHDNSTLGFNFDSEEIIIPFQVRTASLTERTFDIAKEEAGHSRPRRGTETLQN